MPEIIDENRRAATEFIVNQILQRLEQKDLVSHLSPASLRFLDHVIGAEGMVDVEYAHNQQEAMQRFTEEAERLIGLPDRQEGEQGISPSPISNFIKNGRGRFYELLNGIIPLQGLRDGLNMTGTTAVSERHFEETVEAYTEGEMGRTQSNVFSQEYWQSVRNGTPHRRFNRGANAWQREVVHLPSQGQKALDLFEELRTLQLTEQNLQQQMTKHRVDETGSQTEEELIAEKERLVNQINILRARRQEKSEKIEQAQKDKESHGADSEKAEKETTTSNAQVEKINKELTAAQTKKTALETEVAALKQQLGNHAIESENVSNSVDELTVKEAEIKVEIEKLTEYQKAREAEELSKERPVERDKLPREIVDGMQTFPHLEAQLFKDWKEKHIPDVVHFNNNVKVSENGNLIIDGKDIQWWLPSDSRPTESSDASDIRLETELVKLLKSFDLSEAQLAVLSQNKDKTPVEINVKNAELQNIQRKLAAHQRNEIRKSLGEKNNELRQVVTSIEALESRYDDATRERSDINAQHVDAKSQGKIRDVEIQASEKEIAELTAELAQLEGASNNVTQKFERKIVSTGAIHIKEGDKNPSRDMVKMNILKHKKTRKDAEGKDVVVEDEERTDFAVDFFEATERQLNHVRARRNEIYGELGQLHSEVEREVTEQRQPWKKIMRQTKESVFGTMKWGYNEGKNIITHEKTEKLASWTFNTAIPAVWNTFVGIGNWWGKRHERAATKWSKKKEIAESKNTIRDKKSNTMFGKTISGLGSLFKWGGNSVANIGIGAVNAPIGAVKVAASVGDTAVNAVAQGVFRTGGPVSAMADKIKTIGFLPRSAANDSSGSSDKKTGTK